MNLRTLRSGLLLGVLALFPSVLPASAVEQWGLFEIALPGPSGGNPFLDVALSATFRHGDRAVEAPGFYDGDGVYRIRFMPETAGEWTYLTRSNRRELDGRTGRFAAAAPSAGNHGPVGVRDTYHFAYADGTPFFELGTTCYSWAHAPDDREEQTLRTLAASPFNKLRMCVLPQDFAFDGQSSPRYPYVGAPPRNWDFTRFNPDFFRHLELRIGQLRDLGIEADLILFHPYEHTWGFNEQDAATDDRYLRYVVARFAAYRNVWWSMANEYDFMRWKRESDWDRMFQVVEHADPCGHLRSIHNGFRIYNDTLPWVTHASIQNGSAVESPGRAILYRDVFRKPVVFDEVNYEGAISQRWGQLTAEDLVLRFWCGTIAGTYVGHSEIFARPGHSWLADGGELLGKSPPRLAFLRRIVEEAPGGEIEPIDKWEDRRMGGAPGLYYLLYFGRRTPKRWPFDLPREGVKQGDRFAVEVIDTWAMTVAPVPGIFTAARKDAYDFIDAEARSVPLPVKPYLALRIRRVKQGG